MKKIIRTAWEGRRLDEDKLCRALLQYRNTPSRKDGLSPAQKLFGRPVQDSIPAHRRSFSNEWQQAAREADQKEVHTREETKYSYNLHARSLPDITVGSHVAIQNSESKMWNIYGTVVDIGPHRRYYVKTHSGRIFVRNRRFLRRRVPLSMPTSDYVPPDNHNSPPRQADPADTNNHSTTTPLRRSTRPRKPNRRLIESPNWP